ncbi:MAG: hypothetical protein JXA67_14650 [Micromonosporaceae bacterium]|nr:hypothetical protein [Micromonosporaceae bacterium]
MFGIGGPQSGMSRLRILRWEVLRRPIVVGQVTCAVSAAAVIAGWVSIEHGPFHPACG